MLSKAKLALLNKWGIVPMSVATAIPTLEIGETMGIGTLRIFIRAGVKMIPPPNPVMEEIKAPSIPVIAKGINLALNSFILVSLFLIIKSLMAMISNIPPIIFFASAVLIKSKTCAPISPPTTHIRIKLIRSLKGGSRPLR